MNKKLRRRAETLVWHLIGAPVLRPLLGLVEPILARRHKRRWERDWRVESERPVSQLATTVPAELVDAVESGWVPPASAVMDVGSGRGQVSAWLAERGFRVLGADFSDEATLLARRHFGDYGGRLEFRTVDMCTATPEHGRFDWLVDRGCFHVIPEPHCARYVDHLVAWAKDDARLLLICRMPRVEAALEFFQPYFEIVRTVDGPYERSAGSYPRDLTTARTFWMIRRTAERASRP